VARPAQLEWAGHLLASIRSAEPRTAGAQRRGDRVEILDAESQVVDALLITAQAHFAQLGVLEGEDLERPAALAEERRRYPVLRQLEGPRERQAEALLGALDRGVEVANEESDVVKLSEQRPASLTQPRGAQDFAAWRSQSTSETAVRCGR
jgi:hypothetical protein